MVNRKMKPAAHSIGVLNSTEPRHMVAIHENTLMPVGTAMTMLATAKYAWVAVERPTVYMWCAHTTMPIAPMARIA
jgi:hypothetical protein